MFHIGLDVHQKTSTYCILDGDGRRVKTETVRGRWDRVVGRLRTITEPFRICFEASCGYGFLYDQLSRIAKEVFVAHPGQLRLIFRSKRKNDRVDAEKLAKLLYLNEVPRAYVPSIQVRDWRALIEYRRRTVDKMTRTKNQIRTLLRSQGRRGPKGLWTRKGLTWLGQQQWPTESAALQRDILLEDLLGTREQIRRLTKRLDEIGAEHPGVTVLRTIPGVGPRTAETIVAYIDDPDRFTHAHQVGSYFGLVPCQDASAGVNRLGRITKDGPATGRKYLTEAAWSAQRRSPRVKAYFQRLMREDPARKKKALIATAHWLVRCMWSMLRSGECWREAA